MMLLAACALVGAGCGYDDSELTRNIDAIDKELSALENSFSLPDRVRNFQPWKRPRLK